MQVVMTNAGTGLAEGFSTSTVCLRGDEEFMVAEDVSVISPLEDV